ncbi:hypothetical protein ES703_85147 [subsurface metagenome]
MGLDQYGAPLAELAIVLCEPANALHLLGRQRTQLDVALAAPGEDRGGVARAVGSGAVAGGFAAAGLELVDGAFEGFAYSEEILDQALLLFKQLPQELPLSAGAYGSRGHGYSLSCISVKHTDYSMSFARNEPNGKILGGRCLREQDQRTASNDRKAVWRGSRPLPTPSSTVEPLNRLNYCLNRSARSTAPADCFSRDRRAIRSCGSHCGPFQKPSPRPRRCKQSIGGSQAQWFIQKAGNVVSGIRYHFQPWPCSP